MSLASYSDLVAAVGDWLDRDDLAARVPTFVTMTEARLNRVLDDPAMEASATLTGNGASLPADFGAMVSVGTANGNRLTQMSDVEYAAVRPQSGISRYYTIREGKLFYVPGGATVTLLYRRRIPALTSSNPSNWLLERAPDLYLYGALVQASAFLVEDERVPMWRAAFDEALAELRADGDRRKWGAGPIAPRIRRS